MTFTIRSAAMSAFAAIGLITMAGCQRPDDAAFGARVRSYLLAHPEVLREVSVKLQESDRLAAQKASSDTLAKYRGQLERDNRDLVVNPTGKITVVEFFDYRCGYCKLAAPQVLDLIARNPDVRFVFKQFPIFGEVSDTAAKIALTDAGKAKGLQLYRVLMSEKALNDTALDRRLAEVGISATQARADAQSPAIERQILDTRALAETLKIDGTPAFIVGDSLIPGADIAALKSAIAKTRGGAFASGGN